MEHKSGIKLQNNCQLSHFEECFYQDSLCCRCSCFCSMPLPGLFNDCQLNTLTLRKGNPWFCPLSNDEHIPQPSCKFMPTGILNMDGLKGTLMLLPALDDSNTSPIPSTSHHDYIPNIELDEICDLVALQV